MARRAGGQVLSLAWVRRAVVAVAPHPSLWPTGLRQARRLAQPGWWRHRPFLPIPAPDYLRFRLETAYGGAGDQAPDPDDLVSYLRWCRELPSGPNRPSSRRRRQ